MTDEGKAVVTGLVPASLKQRIVKAAAKKEVSLVQWCIRAYEEKLRREGQGE